MSPCIPGISTHVCHLVPTELIADQALLETDIIIQQHNLELHGGTLHAIVHNRAGLSIIKAYLYPFGEKMCLRGPMRRR